MIEALLLSLLGGVIGASLAWLFFNGHSVSTLGGRFRAVVFQLTVTRSDHHGHRLGLHHRSARRFLSRAARGAAAGGGSIARRLTHHRRNSSGSMHGWS
jgi:hypothetical protein